MAKKNKRQVRRSTKRPIKRKKAVKRLVKKAVKRLVKKPSKKFAPSAAQARALKTQRTSFGVRYERRRYLRKIRGANGLISSPGSSRTSDRRFATAKEATHHGKRFKRIERHVSFTVVKDFRRPNAWVNWKTGKTNPVIGARRTNRR